MNIIYNGQKIGMRIKKIRTRLNMNQTEFGGLFGVTQEAVSSWERKGNPELKMLFKIAKFSDTPLDNILTGKREKKRKKSDEGGKSLLEPLKLDDQPPQSRSSCKTAPMISDAVAAGPPSDIGPEDVSGYLHLPDLLADKEIFLMRVRDNSMGAILKKKDVVALFPYTKSPGALEGMIVAAWTEDGLNVRWLSSDRKHWILCSEDRSFSPILIEKEAKTRFFRVVWWWGLNNEKR